jgi:hypothetical protein
MRTCSVLGMGCNASEESLLFFLLSLQIPVFKPRKTWQHTACFLSKKVEAHGMPFLRASPASHFRKVPATTICSASLSLEQDQKRKPMESMFCVQNHSMHQPCVWPACIGISKTAKTQDMLLSFLRLLQSKLRRSIRMVWRSWGLQKRNAFWLHECAGCLPPQDLYLSTSLTAERESKGRCKRGMA